MDIWRYENPGYAELLNGPGTTISVDLRKSVTDTAFYGGVNTADMLNTPAGVKEVWFKFDLYLDNELSDTRFNFGHYSSALRGWVGIWNSGGGSYNLVTDAKPKTDMSTGISGKGGAINEILLHMKSDATNGFITITVNNTDLTKYYSYVGNVNNGADFDCLYFYSSTPKALFSNIIVSESEIQDYEGWHGTLFDVEAKITGGAKGWQYHNPGYAELLSVTDATTEYVDLRKSVTGVAFCGGSKLDMFFTPAGLKEVWLRFDMYFGGNSAYSFSSSSRVHIGFYNPTTGKVPVAVQFGAAGVVQANLPVVIMDDITFYVPRDTITRLLLHMRSGETRGVVELTVNGNTTYTYIGEVNNGEPFDRLLLYTNFGYSEGNHFLFSNIIVSESILDIDEGWHAVVAPVETAVTVPSLYVRSLSRAVELPLQATPNPPTPSLAIWWNGRSWYNPLVGTNNEKASNIKVRHDNKTYALSATL